MFFCSRTYRILGALTLIPLIICSVLLGVYFPRAPRVSATSIMVNSASFKNLRLSLAVDIQVLIANENLAADLAFDDVNITYFYPNKPDNIIGTGVIPGAILSKGGQVERTLRSEFDAPIATFGSEFLKDLNAGKSQLALHGKVSITERGMTTLTVLGYSPFLATTYRLASDVDCIVTYDWASGNTAKDCKYDGKVAIAKKGEGSSS